MNKSSKKNKIFQITTSLLFLLPSFAFAALEGLEDLLRSARTLLNLLFPVMIAAAIAFFFWGLGQFVLNEAGNDKTREDGKKKILWGIIAIFVMVSIWGIINLIGNTLGITSQVQFFN